MAEKKGKELFLRPSERLDTRLTGLAEEFELEHRQGVVLAVLRDFLGPWERIERRKRELIAESERSIIAKLDASLLANPESDDDAEPGKTLGAPFTEAPSQDEDEASINTK